MSKAAQVRMRVERQRWPVVVIENDIAVVLVPKGTVLVGGAHIVEMPDNEDEFDHVTLPIPIGVMSNLRQILAGKD